MQRAAVVFRWLQRTFVAEMLCMPSVFAARMQRSVWCMCFSMTERVAANHEYGSAFLVKRSSHQQRGSLCSEN